MYHSNENVLIQLLSIFAEKFSTLKLLRFKYGNTKNFNEKIITNTYCMCIMIGLDKTSFNAKENQNKKIHLP